MYLTDLQYLFILLIARSFPAPYYKTPVDAEPVLVLLLELTASLALSCTVACCFVFIPATIIDNLFKLEAELCSCFTTK